MLARIELDQLHAVALNHVRQHIVVAGLAHLRQHSGVTIELEDSALGSQFEIARRHADGSREVLRRRHLAGHELAPDQLVQALGVTLHARQLARVGVDVGRTNRFVRLLRAFLTAIDVRRIRQVFLAEFVLDVSASHGHRVSRQVGRVGTHVGDVTGFVQTLGHHHGFLHAIAQAVARGLLQGRRDERRGRLAAGRFVFALGDAVGRNLELLQCRHGLGFV